MKTTLAVLDKKSHNAEQAVLAVLDSFERTESECIKIFAPRLSDAQRSRRAQRAETVPKVAVGSIFLDNEPSIVKCENVALAFHGSIYSPMFRTSPIATIAKAVFKERERALEKAIIDFEGDFTSIIAEPERIVAGRDPTGARPLYYGENLAHAAIGTNRKVLWKLGIEETCSFPPGHLGVLTGHGFKFKPIKTLRFSEPKHTTMNSAVNSLLRMLERSIRIRVRDKKEVAIAFSGGLDSSMVAALVKKSHAGVLLVHVSLKGQSETEEAKKAADELNLPLKVNLFQEEDVANIVAKVVNLIEESDPVKTAIGIPLYWAAQKTADAGLKVLLAGQGADEFFGGYQRYFNEYRFQGEEETRRTMFFDVARIHESNLERDQKICNFHNVELRLPFASYEIEEFATILPLELKIDCTTESARKLVLRRAAEKMGLPTWIARKPKKAIQYATGVTSTLKKLAKKRKITIGEYVGQLFMAYKSS